MIVEHIKSLKRQLVKEYGKSLKSDEFPAVIRVQVEVGDSFDPLCWLASQQEYPKFFWRSEDRGRVLAYAGSAAVFTNSDRLLTNDSWMTIREWMQKEPSLRCWGGASFHSRITGAEWSDFDAWIMHIPKIGLERDPVSARWHMVCQAVLMSKEDAVPELVADILDKAVYKENISSFSPDIISVEESPSYDQWQELIRQALEYIKDKTLSKLVLSRRLRLVLSSAVAPEIVLSELLEQTGSAFLCSPAPMTGFLGVSPELLFHRKRDRLDAFALAGTRPRGKDELEDRILKTALASSTKDKKEHKQVVDMLLNKLGSLCVLSKLYGKGGMIELPNQRHFLQRLRGRILEGVTDESIINALHPTPAVGGVPTQEAMKILSSIEPFDRGWFTGTVGWLSRDESEIAVGIRSALVRQAEWYVYGGAGIVEGSTAIAEWEEINLKMKNILDIIHAR